MLFCNRAFNLWRSTLVSRSVMLTFGVTWCCSLFQVACLKLLAPFKHAFSYVEILGTFKSEKQFLYAWLVGACTLAKPRNARREAKIILSCVVKENIGFLTVNVSSKVWLTPTTENMNLYSIHSALMLNKTVALAFRISTYSEIKWVSAIPPSSWETLQKKLIHWRSLPAKLTLSLCSISPSLPNQCWLAISRSNMDWKRDNDGEGDILLWALEPVFSVWEAAVSHLVLHAIAVLELGGLRQRGWWHEVTGKNSWTFER